MKTLPCKNSPLACKNNPSAWAHFREMRIWASLSFLLLSLSLFAAPATNSTAKADAKAQIREEGTDEIDLEEIDDAALASKKAAVKATAQNTEYVDISCDEATLADILRQFRKTTRANIICENSSNLQQRVSAELKHVPWFEALTSILGSRGYTLEERKGIYYVKEQRELKPILTRPFSLKHASCKDLADLFNATYAPKDKAGKILSPIANAFEGANVVVVTSTENVLRDCEKIIESIDKAVAQVYIEARFLELSNEALHKLGIQWNALESWRVTASGLKAGWQSSRGTAANYGVGQTGGTTTKNITDTTTSSANTSVSDGSVSTSASSSKSPSTTSTASTTTTGLFPLSIGEASGAGLSAADMAWEDARGFSGQLSAQDFSLALSAFESLGDGKVFSNPRIIVSNGKEANVDMTTKFPNVDVSSQRNTSTTTPYTDISAKIQVIPGDKAVNCFAGDIFYSWGITLSVKPRISTDGLISVEIVPTISSVDEFYSVGQSGDDTSAYAKYPIIEMKRIKTEFTMKDGATAVIGGLSRTAEEDVDSGIPYLRKIPWIGPRLFGWKSRQKTQKEIIVCVTLGIADPGSLAEDAGLPTNAIIGREYVRGKRLEPGLRKGDADKLLLKLDKSSIDGRIDKKEREKEAKAFEQPEDLKAGEIRMTVSEEPTVKEEPKKEE